MAHPALKRIPRRPRVRASRVLPLAILAGATSIAALSFAAPNVRPPSPFVALATGHKGRAYKDQVRDAFDGPASNYRLVSGTLPLGLTLDATTGEIKGTPTEAKVAHVRVAAKQGGADKEVRATISVFSADESEIRKGQSFEGNGPFATTKRSENFSWTSSFDQKTRKANVLIYAPAAAAGNALPLLVHHRGRGFGHDDYDDFLSQVASWGIVCASVSDNESFYSPRDPNAADPDYDYTRAELGMYSASSAQEATMDAVLGLASTPGDALAGRIDNEAVFLSGHSRGGGATHASHVRSLPLRTRGVIYFMAFDLRYFVETAPPGVAPAYPVPTSQNRLPSLVFSAENDGDLTYPIADQFIDRATGPTTFVTVYGGVHNLLGDDNADEGGATIARLDEQRRIASFVVAFVRRWAKDDLSLDGFLYGDEHATSNKYGVASWRRTSPTLLVDDFQDGDANKNVLGGADTVIQLRRKEASVYPQEGELSRLGLKHSIVAFDKQVSDFLLALGPAGTTRDLTGYDRLLLRVMQTGQDGWKVSTWARLRDAAGQTGYVLISRSDGASVGYLPGNFSKRSYDRFVNVSVPLAKFKAQNPSLDLSKIDRLDFVFQLANPSSREVAVDDVRFE